MIAAQADFSLQGTMEMHVRCAIFEGTVAEADQPKFDACIKDKVMPIILGFPKIRAMRVLRARSVEDDGPPVYQIFELQFDTAEDAAAALATPKRAESRAALAEIMPLFKGRIYHINLNLNERRP